MAGGRSPVFGRPGDEDLPVLTVDAVEAVEPLPRGCPAGQRQCPRLQRLFQPLTESLAELPHQRCHRDQTARIGHIPPRALRRQAAAGHETVQMGMKAQPVVPGLQRHRDARFRAQPARIGEQGPQRIRGAVEQQVAQDLRIPPPQGVEGMWHGEHRMIMAHRQQLRLLLQQPGPAHPARAARTEAMAAGVVEDTRDMPLRAAFHMPPERGRVTGGQHPHRLPHVLLERLRRLERRIRGRQQVEQSVRRRRHHLDLRRRDAIQTIRNALTGGESGLVELGKLVELLEWGKLVEWVQWVELVEWVEWVEWVEVVLVVLVVLTLLIEGCHRGQFW